jgi:alginate O-acetyltransferase complex protein AlgI
MNLNSHIFFLFFAAVFLLIRWSGSFGPVVLLISSYIFYASWNFAYVPVLLASTAVGFYCAQQISIREDLTGRRAFLGMSLAFNLGLLIYFKYASQLMGGSFDTPLIPIGLSFYTFQSMGYVVDVYLRKVSAEKSFLNLANFVSFFPQLIAGPIERASKLIPQISGCEGFRANREQVLRGGYLIFLGLFMSLGLAENLAPFSLSIREGLQANAFAMGHEPAWLDFVFSFYAYPFTLYLRFAGYSFLAMGFALLLGIELSVNFKYPFFSTSMPEFWSRWHISLSKWIRDYVFFPLSQNIRSDSGLYGCIFLTTFIFAIWHEASAGWMIAALILATYSVGGHILFRNRHQASVTRRIFGALVTFHIFALAMMFVNNVSNGQSLFSFGEALKDVVVLDLNFSLERHHFQIFKYVAVALLIDAVNFAQKDIYGILRLRRPYRVAMVSFMVLFLFFNQAKESGLSIYFRM